MLDQNGPSDSKFLADTQVYVTNNRLVITQKIDEDCLKNSWANMSEIKDNKYITDLDGDPNYEPPNFQLAISKSRKKNMKQRSKTKKITIPMIRVLHLSLCLEMHLLEFEGIGQCPRYIGPQESYHFSQVDFFLLLNHE